MTDKRLDVHNSQLPRICISCEARHKGLCGALNAAELLALSRHTRQSRHVSGDELIGDAEPVEAYASVMKGVVKLSKVLEDGRQQVVGLQFAPDFLGRVYATESHVTAEAASEVDLCKVPRQVLESLMAENPALERRLVQQTLRELDEARDWMVTLGRKTAGEKVASFLYLIATHIDPTLVPDNAASTRFDLPLKRADIADFLGLTIETVSRELTKLKTQGVIRIENTRAFHIPDLARLRARCG